MCTGRRCPLPQVFETKCRIHTMDKVNLYCCRYRSLLHSEWEGRGGEGRSRIGGLLLCCQVAKKSGCSTFSSSPQRVTSRAVVSLDLRYPICVD